MAAEHKANIRQTPRRQIYLVLESVCPHENKNMHKPLVCKITSSQLHLNQIQRKWQRVLMMDDEQKTEIVSVTYISSISLTALPF